MTAFQGMTRLCLNNWHYIHEKVLSFSTGINFFTGHSGSGKSTVLDALQLMLYADTNGRGFFNKAAKDDSDRTLMEYLRGMKEVKENGEAGYLRNQNFSTTIVLEFQNSENGQYQCIGLVFDVDVAANEAERMFFWHQGRMPSGFYRTDNRAMSIRELKDWLGIRFEKDEWDYSRTNEKFRARLYETYFGGLDDKKFPALFKKAIPFRMNMKLEDFVKNYICMEKNIHIEDMQDSVVQYVRLRRRLEDTKKEIAMLEDIHGQYEVFKTYQDKALQFQYNMDKLDIYTARRRLEEIMQKQKAYRQDTADLTERIKKAAGEIEGLQRERDEVMLAIENSGYTHLESELNALDQLMEFLQDSQGRYDRVCRGLEKWLDEAAVSGETKALIERFIQGQAGREDMEGIKNAVKKARGDVLREKEDAAEKVKEYRAQAQDIRTEIEQLKGGGKAYPAYLENAREFLSRELEKQFGEPAAVDILADLLEIKDAGWQNAIEGYMGNHKFSIMVPPEFTKAAIELYHTLDARDYHKVSVVDTKQVMQRVKPPLPGSLAEEVEAVTEYARAYLDFLLGTVIKCDSAEALRLTKSGVTKDCLLYQGYKLQHMNPRNYTDFAYIGKQAAQKRLGRLEKRLAGIKADIRPFLEQLEACEEKLGYEAFGEDISVYEKYVEDKQRIHEKQQEKEALKAKLQELKSQDIEAWKARKALLEQELKVQTGRKEQFSGEQRNKARLLGDFEEELIVLSKELAHKEGDFACHEEGENAFKAMLREHSGERPERLKSWLSAQKQGADIKADQEYERLLTLRERYQQDYGYRGFSTAGRDNKDYDTLLGKLKSDKLQEFTEKAAGQAKVAIHHFKTDFIYKIRDSIKEAMQQKDELNAILAKTDFGKEKYRFIITKNKGDDGRFYRMFMDENLEVNPSQLSNHMDNQMDLFSKGHAESYNDLINELIEIFMPPENSDMKELEEARHNMERYADYRTYLSFDMEQIIEGMPPMRLSKMLSKIQEGKARIPFMWRFWQALPRCIRPKARSTQRGGPRPVLLCWMRPFPKWMGKR